MPRKWSLGKRAFLMIHVRAELGTDLGKTHRAIAATLSTRLTMISSLPLFSAAFVAIHSPAPSDLADLAPRTLRKVHWTVAF